MKDRSPGEYRKILFLHLLFGALAAIVFAVVVADRRWSFTRLRDVVDLWPLVVLGYSIFVHAAIARGAWLRRTWVFDESRDLGALLLLAAPFGTIPGIVILVSQWNNRFEIARRPPQVPLTEAWPDRATRDSESKPEPAGS